MPPCRNKRSRHSREGGNPYARAWKFEYNAKVNKRKKLLCLWLWIPAFAGMTIILSSPAHTLMSVHTITLMADHSMGIAIAEIARSYTRDRHVAVNISFAPSAMQATQIMEGAAADVLITPKLAWIEQLKAQGLTDVYSQTPIARGRLALAGPGDSPLTVNLKERFPRAALINQMEGEQRFVVGHPETLMEGVYGREALRNLRVSGDLEAYTLYIKRLDEMIEMVAQHHAYGVFFHSTVIGRSDVRVLDLLPEKSHKPIEYHAVVIAGENMDEARKFLEYLKSYEAKSILQRNGFVLK